jgi:hypothetical protein
MKTSDTDRGPSHRGTTATHTKHGLIYLVRDKNDQRNVVGKQGVVERDVPQLSIEDSTPSRTGALHEILTSSSTDMWVRSNRYRADIDLAWYRYESCNAHSMVQGVAEPECDICFLIMNTLGKELVVIASGWGAWK